MGLIFDPILHGISHCNIQIGLSKLTAPYFEICLTKSAANLKRGRGTMLLMGGSLRRRLQSL